MLLRPFALPPQILIRAGCKGFSQRCVLITQGTPGDENELNLD